jgi:hypothetical protein
MDHRRVHRDHQVERRDWCRCVGEIVPAARPVDKSQADGRIIGGPPRRRLRLPPAARFEEHLAKVRQPVREGREDRNRSAYELNGFGVTPLAREDHARQVHRVTSLGNRPQYPLIEFACVGQPAGLAAGDRVARVFSVSSPGPSVCMGKEIEAIR